MKPLEWLIAACLAFMGFVLLIALGKMASAQTFLIMNRPGQVWQWRDWPGTADFFEVEAEAGAVRTYHTTPSREIAIAPPDRTATTPIRIRVRACRFQASPQCDAWGEPTRWAYGVPVGFDPDWTGDGAIMANDFDPWFRAFSEGWEWPR